MSEDAIFFRQAAEAIVATSLNSSNIDPTIRELLNRIKSKPILNNPISASHNDNHSSTAQSSLLDIFNQAIGNHNDLNSNNREYSIDLPTTTSPPSFKSPLVNERNREAYIPKTSVSTSSAITSIKKRKGKKVKANVNNSNRNFPCEKCELVFNRLSDLRRHEKAHLPILPHICLQCGKGFARKDALKRHYDTLTCKRNRSKLLSLGGGDINEILEKVRKNGTNL